MKKLNVEELREKLNKQSFMEGFQGVKQLGLTEFIYLEYNENEDEDYKYTLFTSFDGEILDSFSSFEEAILAVPAYQEEIEKRKK